MPRMNLMSGSALLAAVVAAVPAASPAQNKAQVSEIIVYGTDPCPRSTDDEIVVCARKPEAERYRIPERLRTPGGFQSRQSWANKAKQFEVVGRTGINSCSPVGPAGFTGCTEQLIRDAFAERGEQVRNETAPR